MIRPTKKKRLNKAKIIHAAGWIRAEDVDAFDKLVAKAKTAYDKIMGEKR